MKNNTLIFTSLFVVTISCLAPPSFAEARQKQAQSEIRVSSDMLSERVSNTITILCKMGFAALVVKAVTATVNFISATRIAGAVAEAIGENANGFDPPPPPSPPHARPAVQPGGNAGASAPAARNCFFPPTPQGGLPSTLFMGTMGYLASADQCSFAQSTKRGRDFMRAHLQNAQARSRENLQVLDFQIGSRQDQFTWVHSRNLAVNLNPSSGLVSIINFSPYRRINFPRLEANSFIVVEDRWVVLIRAEGRRVAVIDLNELQNIDLNNPQIPLRDIEVQNTALQLIALQGRVAILNAPGSKRSVSVIGLNNPDTRVRNIEFSYHYPYRDFVAVEHRWLVSNIDDNGYVTVIDLNSPADNIRLIRFGWHHFQRQRPFIMGHWVMFTSQDNRVVSMLNLANLEAGAKHIRVETVPTRLVAAGRRVVIGWVATNREHHDYGEQVISVIDLDDLGAGAQSIQVGPSYGGERSLNGLIVAGGRVVTASTADVHRDRLTISVVNLSNLRVDYQSTSSDTFTSGSVIAGNQIVTIDSREGRIAAIEFNGPLPTVRPIATIPGGIQAHAIWGTWALVARAGGRILVINLLTGEVESRLKVPGEEISSIQMGEDVTRVVHSDGRSSFLNIGRRFSPHFSPRPSSDVITASAVQIAGEAAAAPVAAAAAPQRSPSLLDDSADALERIRTLRTNTGVMVTQSAAALLRTHLKRKEGRALAVVADHLNRIIGDDIYGPAELLNDDNNRRLLDMVADYFLERAKAELDENRPPETVSGYANRLRVLRDISARLRTFIEEGTAGPDSALKDELLKWETRIGAQIKRVISSDSSSSLPSSSSSSSSSS